MEHNRDVHTEQEQRKSIADIIKEKMQERGLSQRDLVPIIGSRSKVSEILREKREITLPVARALYKHLDIPAHVLLQDPPDMSVEQNINWARFPIREMIKKGWIEPDDESAKCAEELIRPLFEASGSTHATLLPRKNDQNRANAKLNPYALLAWQWQVCKKAKMANPSNYMRGTVTPDFMRSIAHMSPRKTGPREAADFLTKECGIPVVHVPHLSRTYLDAAVFFVRGRPIIGITLRFNRIDNFWYTLMHELAHICLHSDTPSNSYIDDMTMKVDDANVVEMEADKLAEQSLIPDGAWEESGILYSPTPQDVTALAMELGINPAIVAGRIRHETGEYRKLSQFVGNGSVRRLFMQ